MKLILECALGLSWFAVVLVAWLTGDFVPAVLWLAGFAYYLGEYNGGFDLIRDMLDGLMRKKA